MNDGFFLGVVVVVVVDLVVGLVVVVVVCGFCCLIFLDTKLWFGPQSSVDSSLSSAQFAIPSHFLRCNQQIYNFTLTPKNPHQSLCTRAHTHTHTHIHTQERGGSHHLRV